METYIEKFQQQKSIQLLHAAVEELSNSQCFVQRSKFGFIVKNKITDEIEMDNETPLPKKLADITIDDVKTAVSESLLSESEKSQKRSFIAKLLSKSQEKLNAALTDLDGQTDAASPAAHCQLLRSKLYLLDNLPNNK
jgi:hypothetical protein